MKKISIYLSSGRISFVLVFFVCLSIMAFPQDKREKLQRNKKQLEEEIRYTSSLLQETQKSKENSLHKLQILNNQIGKRQSLIDAMNNEIGQIDLDIDTQKVQIQKLGNELQRMKDEYARLIYYAYKNLNAYNRLMFLFASDDFNQAFHRLKYYQQYSAYRRTQAQLIFKTQAELTAQKKNLEQTKSDKMSLVGMKEQEKDKLTLEKDQKDKTVKELSKKEKQLLATLKEKQQAAEKLQREIEHLIAEEVKASAARAKKAEKTNTAAKTEKDKTEMMLTPVEKQLSSTFAANKGKLPWPSERGIVTGTFGEHPHPVLKYVKVKNNGIDISTEKGATARAVFSGKVSRVMSFPNLNRVVIIRHGDYLTVYSNLEKVNVKDGDEVVTKQPIGIVHTNPEDSRTELHFELWLGKNIQDPQEWLAGSN